MPKKSILIIEDEKINMELLNIFLGKHYSLTFADKLEVAKEHISKSTFDLIITDIRLAERLDGIKVLNYTRKSKLNYQTPVVAYTASDTSVNQRSFIEEGFDGFISKPIIEKELLKKVKQLLGL